MTRYGKDVQSIYRDLAIVLAHPAFRDGSCVLDRLERLAEVRSDG